MRFLGNIEAKIDAKGRAFLPAQFRKALQAQGETELVLRQDIFEHTLVIYPEAVWHSLIDTMRTNLSRWNREEQMVYRTFVGGMTPLTIDGNGRILLPRPMLEAAGIGQTLRFVGMGDTIELWPAETENQPTMEAEAFGQALEKIMGGKELPF